jgi:hypothetical protein
MRRAALCVFVFACGKPVTQPVVTTAPPADVVPVIDELAYYDALSARRPDLLASECYDALAVKPKYRDALLRRGDSVAAIRARTYDAESRAHDAKWTAAFQASELAYCAEHGGPLGCAMICKEPCDVCASAPPALEAHGAPPFAPSGYSICNFVGYQVGPLHRATGKIRDYKVFFEIDDAHIDALTPEAYLAFTAELAKADFHGDSKISMGPGRVRYQYNDIIVHSRSPEDAAIAERVGLRVFAGIVASRARGLDLEAPKAPGGVLDWHHYLCAEGKAGIPAEGLAYVRGKR